MISLFGLFQNKAKEFCFGPREPKLTLPMEVGGGGEAETGRRGIPGYRRGIESSSKYKGRITWYRK